MPKNWLIAAVLVLLAQVSALGARLSIEWEAIPGAARYEVQIFRGRKLVTHPLVSSGRVTWVGELPTGRYTYRLRGISQDQQPGAWSETFQIALGPNGAEPFSPSGGERVQGKVELQWKAVPDATQYRVDVTRGGVSVLSNVVSGTSTMFVPNADGAYEWRVSSIGEIFENGKRRSLSGSPGPAAGFVVGAGEKLPSEIGVSAATVPYRYADARPISYALGALAEIGLAKDVSAHFSLTVLDAKFDLFEIPRFHLLASGRHVFGAADWQWGVEVGARVTTLFDTTADEIHLGERFTGIGPALAVDLTHPISQKLSLSLRADYAVFLALLGTSPGVAASTRLDRNFGLTFAARLRLPPSWSLIASIAVEQTGARYTTASGSLRTIGLTSFPITIALLRSL